MAGAGFADVEIRTVRHSIYVPSASAFWEANVRSSAPLSLSCGRALRRAGGPSSAQKWSRAMNANSDAARSKRRGRRTSVSERGRHSVGTPGLRNRRSFRPGLRNRSELHVILTSSDPKLTNPTTMRFDLNETFDILERTPAVLDMLLRGTSAEWHAINEGPETWSAIDVVGHLVHGEETDWVTRAQIILEHGEARPFDPFDRFAQLTRFSGWSLDDLLDRFAEARRENLVTARGWELTDDELILHGRHPAFVGPWSAYLSILSHESRT